MAEKTKTSIEESALATLKRLEEKDRGLKQVLKKAHAYAVFPSVGKASLVVGGSHGRGAVFEKGKFIGHATISQLTIGVQIGGDTFSQVLVFENKQALDRLKKGKMAFAADASAVLVKAGAAAMKGFPYGVAAYTYSRGGMLLEAVIGGQKFKFKPVDEQDQDDQGEEEGEQQQPRGGKAAAGRGKAQASDEDEGDEQEDDEGDAGAADDEEAGALGRTMAGVKSAASRVAEVAKEHPLAATLAGTAVVAGAAFLVVRAIRGSSADQSGQEEDDQDEPEGRADQADEGDEDEADDKRDTLNQLRRRRTRA